MTADGALSNLRAANENFRRERPLPQGGGGHDGRMPPDDLTPKVAVLETHVQHIREDLGGVRGDFKEIRSDIGTMKTDIARMQVTIAHLPTKGWAVGAVLLTIAAIGALNTFSPTIQRWIGTAPTAITGIQQQK